MEEPFCRCPGCGTCKACDQVDRIRKALDVHMSLGKELKKDGRPVPDFARTVRRILREDK